MAIFLVATGLLGLGAALALVVAVRLLRGDINTTGLFAGAAGGVLEPERVQALVITLAIPTFYGVLAISALRAHDLVLSLPEVPDWMLALTAGSQTLYLGGKIARRAARND